MHKTYEQDKHVSALNVVYTGSNSKFVQII